MAACSPAWCQSAHVPVSHHPCTGQPSSATASLRGSFQRHQLPPCSPPGGGCSFGCLTLKLCCAQEVHIPLTNTIQRGPQVMTGFLGPCGCRRRRPLPGCHHDCLLSCVNGETVWNRPFILSPFYLSVGGGGSVDGRKPGWLDPSTKHDTNLH